MPQPQSFIYDTNVLIRVVPQLKVPTEARPFAP